MHVVAARLGHAEAGVTLRVYAHVIQEPTPAVAATFASPVQAAIGGEAEAGVSSFASKGVEKGSVPAGETGSG